MLICDVCGREIKPQEGLNGILHGEFSYSFVDSFAEPEEVEFRRVYHLCPHCATEIRWFISRIKTIRGD